VAATSHMPYLLSSALARVTPDEALPLAGPGLRSTARLAGSSPAMMLDILATNQENIRESLRGLRQELEHIDALLESGDGEKLLQYMEESRQSYERLIPCVLP
jgi:prephenate dehydrogenase